MSKYSEYIKEQYVNNFGIKRPFNIEWIDKLVGYLEDKVSESTLENFVSLLVSKENMNNMTNGDFFAFGMHMLSIDELLNFLESNNIESLELENALEMINQNGIEESNAIDEFIRYMVITNFDKLTISPDMTDLTNGNEEEMRMDCLLGKLPLCKIELSLSELYLENKNSIIFDSLLTRKNLRGTKVGELLMKKIFQEMIEKFPERNLIALNVMASNVDGQRFYERLGGTFAEYTDDGIKTITLDQLNTESDDNILVGYDQEIMRQKAYEEVNRPTLDVMIREGNLQK